MAKIPMRTEHHRRSTRLKRHDYASAGLCFVTTFTRNRESLFGEVHDGQMHLNEFGEIVREEWLRTATIRPNVRLDEFVVMPNHFHGMLLAPASGSVGAVMMQFKSIVAKRINALRGTEGNPIWHRNYHDHIIRNEREYRAIVSYIRHNPEQWSEDPDHPSNIGTAAREL